MESKRIITLKEIYHNIVQLSIQNFGESDHHRELLHNIQMFNHEQALQELFSFKALASQQEIDALK